MIDILLKWTDRAVAIAAGQAMGCTENDESDTSPCLGVMNLSVIGVHSYIGDNSDPENPVVSTVDGWWVLVRIPHGFDIEGTMGQLPVELRPEIFWMGEVGDGELVPRPDITQCPQRAWL